MQLDKNCSPFFKCPGGKRRLIPELLANFPEDFKETEYTYVEPFTGGGALALYLLANFPHLQKKTYLNDKNLYIYNLWKACQKDPTLLLAEYDSFALEPLNKKHFLEVRESLPYLEEEFNADSIRNTAKFFYLNKNCYNGAIRFNKLGKFNSPIGQYPQTQLYNRDQVLAVHNLIQGVKLTCLDFQQVFEQLYSNSARRKWEKMFFYFDPPYVPLSLTSHFTYYTPGGFSMYDQRRLKTVVEQLTSLGAKVMVSNSDSPLTHEIYKDFNRIPIQAQRVINSKGAKRGKITELIIRNY